MTIQSILANVVHGTPTGNYDGSSQDWVSDAAQAADYYHGRGHVQTLLFVTTGFVGTIEVDATLDYNPNTATWFRTASFGGDSVVSTGTVPITVTGNFTWMRLRITDFSAGTIDSVTISY